MASFYLGLPTALFSESAVNQLIIISLHFKKLSPPPPGLEPISLPMMAVGPDGNFLVNDGSGSPLVLLPLPTASTMTNQMLTLDRDQGAKTEKMPSFTLPALSSHVSASRGAL